jgi:hypothetical protein
MYRIEYSPDTTDHLSALTARQRSLVFGAVDKQLVHEPVWKREIANRCGRIPSLPGNFAFASCEYIMT